MKSITVNYPRCAGVNGMSAPPQTQTQTAFECQSGECKFPLMREATTMKATTIGIDLAQHIFVRPASRLNFCSTGERTA
jgi:hypothetical protein